ncbi:MAG: S41 family peptidase [Candidatus Saccharibacteria bacterium]|nr:S41 family peptidase [Candidatus Saccharibacteria bacterium]
MRGDKDLSSEDNYNEVTVKSGHPVNEKGVGSIPPVSYGRPPHSVHPERPAQHGRSVSLLTCIIAAILVGLIGFAIGTRLQNLSVSRLDYASLNDVYNALVSKYDGKLDNKKLLEGAAKGMVAAAGDVYTEYMTDEEYSVLETELSGELNGIGVEIGMNADNKLSVISTLDDSPAREAGIMAGDLITAVDGEDATSWTTSQAAGKIRGDEGTTVKVKVDRDGKSLEFTIERKKIENPSVKWEVKDGIGYMRISTFGEDTADLAKQAAEDFTDQKVKGVVLDLRSNTGGYVDAAQGVASLWLRKGDVITTERAGNKTLSTVKATGGNILGGIPTAVLIDGATASASEIVAGALRDNADATLVGTQSYGKGLVQEVISLNNGDILKVTVAKWYTPNGENINEEGLTPDKEVEMTAAQYNSGDDVQEQAATELLKK